MKKYINISNHNLGRYLIPDNCDRKICVDVGSNVGSFIESNLSRFDEFHYYEPYKPCYDIISKKFDHMQNVKGWNEAVYSEDGLLMSLVSHFNSHSGSNALKTDSVNSHWKEVIQSTTTVSLPTILRRAQGRISYLKIDCETSEYHFLMDHDLKQIDYIGLEIHWQMGKEKFDNLIKHIELTHSLVNITDTAWREETNLELLYAIKK